MRLAQVFLDYAFHCPAADGMEIDDIRDSIVAGQEKV